MSDRKYADHRWFGGRLYELRVNRGWSRRELSIAAGMSIFTIADIETCRRSPTWDTALRLAEAFEVSMDEFRKPPSPPAIRRVEGRPKRMPNIRKKAIEPRIEDE